jgi:hypothetical protein
LVEPEATSRAIQSKISLLVEPVQAKFPEFLGNFVKNDVLVLTIGLSPAESGRFNSWAVVLIQVGRKIIFTGRQDRALEKEQTTICGLLAALRWEHPREKDPDPTFWAPWTIIYPMEIAELIGKIRNGQSNLISDDLEGVCRNIAVMIKAWERNVDFKMFSHEEALATDPIVASWILLAKNGALGAHTYILEDRPELPKSSGPDADEGANSWKGRTHDRRLTDKRTIRKGRRPSFRSGGTIRSFRHCFEGPPHRTNVITPLRQTTKVCRELRIREDGLAYMPRASVGFDVASHHSGAWPSKCYYYRSCLSEVHA